ncbi:hypothetical protein GGR52DRAFT_20628 [Hypoxylon sp. FL1284]|nr:hypothetical protein GGR52DRAFT_20628 [Hypoxylon sp. FL1284]
MLASFITVTAGLAASVAAWPAALGGREVLGNWHMLNFQEACSPGGCVATFNISAPTGYVEGAPAFNVSCHPIYIQRGWMDCDNLASAANGSMVQSMWTGATDRDDIKISVSHLWLEGSAMWNTSGNIEFAPGITSFNIPVTLSAPVA